MQKTVYVIDIDHYLMLIEKYFNFYKPTNEVQLKFLPTLRMPLDKTNPAHIKEIERYRSLGGIDNYISLMPYYPWKCLPMVKEIILEYRHSGIKYDIFKKNFLKNDYETFVSGLTDEEILMSYIPNISMEDGRNILNIICNIYRDVIEPIMLTKDELCVWDIDYTTNIITLILVGNIYEIRYKELLD